MAYPKWRTVPDPSFTGNGVIMTSLLLFDEIWILARNSTNDVMMTSCYVIINQVMPSNLGGPIKSGFEGGEGGWAPKPSSGSRKQKKKKKARSE